MASDRIHYIVPTKRAQRRAEGRTQVATVVPTVDSLAANAVSIIQVELARLQRDAQHGLSTDQSQRLTRYIRAIVMLRRIEKDADDDEFGGMTDEQLVYEVATAYGLNKRRAKRIAGELLSSGGGAT